MGLSEGQRAGLTIQSHRVQGHLWAGVPLAVGLVEEEGGGGAARSRGV